MTRCTWTPEQQRLGKALIEWTEILERRLRRENRYLTLAELIGRGVWHREIVEGLYAQ